MEDYFDIPVNYNYNKKKDLIFKARLIILSYAYKSYITIDE